MRAPIVAASLALVLVGCGGGSSSEEPPSAPATGPDSTGAGGGGDPSAPSDDAPETEPPLTAMSGGAEGSDALPIDLVNGFRVAAIRTYDGTGRLTEREEIEVDPAARELLATGEYTREDGTPVEFDEIARFDAEGRLVRVEYRESSDDDPSLGLFATVIDYEHDDLGRIRTRRTTEDHSQAPSTRIFEWDGPLLLRASERPDEPDGRLFEYRYEPGSSLPNDKLATLWYETDAPAVPDALGAGDDEPELEVAITRSELVWAGPGRLLEKRLDFRDDGSIDEVWTYAYDVDGNMVAETFTDAAGAVLRRKEFDYVPAEFPVQNRWLRIFRFFP